MDIHIPSGEETLPPPRISTASSSSSSTTSGTNNNDNKGLQHLQAKAAARTRKEAANELTGVPTMTIERIKCKLYYKQRICLFTK